MKNQIQLKTTTSNGPFFVFDAPLTLRWAYDSDRLVGILIQTVNPANFLAQNYSKLPAMKIA